jgi:uncharacterized protein (DUF342 family)
VQIGEDDTADKVLVAELVRKDGILLKFENYEKFREKGFIKQSVEAGDNVYAANDGDEFRAEVAGYPKIDHFVSEDGEAKCLRVIIEPLFRFSPDMMKASVVIHPPLADGNSLQQFGIEELLTEAGITYGLDQEKLEKVQHCIDSGLMEFNTIAIATGRECGLSEDAYLNFEIEIGPIAGKLLPDGSIDFRERRIMVPVSDGQLLATKIPAASGTHGVNVLGEEVVAAPGKDIAIKTSGEAYYDPETMQVRATSDGVLSVVRGSVLTVSSRHEVAGDIDFETGNIESKNSIVIRGSVQPGFQVKAGGDLEIGKTVSSANIECQANVVIKGGITGRKTQISAEGDTDILFIEQGRVVSGGNCVVRKQVYYSSIHSGENIRCKRDSVVVGGELVAAGSISVGDVGSDKSTAAFLAAGVLPERLELYRQLKSQQADLQSAILRQLETGGGRSRKLRHMEREAAGIKQKLMRMNMIPGTGLYSRAGAGDDDQFTAEEYSVEYSIDITEISIEVFGTLQAGTLLQIGNRTLTVDKTISSRKFRLNDNRKRILALPLGRKRA